MSIIANDKISFEEAIAFTETLMAQMPKMGEEEKKLAISSLVGTNNGARGFFVTYLTSDQAIVEQYTTGVITALQTSPEIVGELLVKNVAMSTAMKVHHLRNNDPEMAEKSARVAKRCSKLIQELDSDLIQEKIAKLKNTIEQEQGEYQSFLKRWGYDQEQKQTIFQAISEI